MKLSAIGDVLAIPFFFALSIYFYKINSKTTFEIILFCFSVSGFIADVYFTYLEIYSSS